MVTAAEVIGSYVDALDLLSGSSTHLDVGCGLGLLTSRLMETLRFSRVFGYDIDLGRINSASRFHVSPGLVFTSSPDVFQLGNYSSATACFVFHELDDPEVIFSRVYRSLVDGGLFGVLDYDMVGCSKTDFLERFVRRAEKEEIKLLGEDECYRLHTSRGLDDCCKVGRQVGFDRVSVDRFQGKYFSWIGRKSL